MVIVCNIRSNLCKENGIHGLEKRQCIAFSSENISNAYIKNCLFSLVLKYYWPLYYHRSRRTAIADKVLELGLSLKTVDKGTLNGLCGNRPHQGVAIDCSPLEYVAVANPQDLLNINDRGLVMILDQVTDPMNLGALLRSAHCFGVSVVVSAKNWWVISQ